MDFYGRNADRCNRVAQSHAGMRISRRIQYDHIELSLSLLNPVHQFAFQVAVPEVGFGPQFGRLLPHFCFYLGQSLSAIDIRLAQTEQVQVWPVKKQNLHSRTERIASI